MPPPKAQSTPEFLKSMQNERTSLKLMAFWSGQFNEVYPNGHKGTIFFENRHLEINYKNPIPYHPELKFGHFVIFEKNLIVFDATLSDGSKGKFIVCMKDNFKFYANQDIREVLNDNFEKGVYLMMESNDLLEVVKNFLDVTINPLENKATYFEINDFPFHSDEYKPKPDSKKILNQFQ